MRISGRIYVSVLVAVLTIGICCGEAWGVFDKARAVFHNGRGLQYLEKGQYDQAITEFTKAIKLEPKLAEVYYNRGVAYGEKGQDNQAISDYTKAIELNPKFAWAYYNRGNAYEEKGHYDQAISDYTKAIELNPRDADVYNNRGLVYVEKGQHDQAIADYTRAIELNPRDADVYNNRGYAYHHKGHYDQAIADYNKAIELNPRDAYAYNNLAWLLATCPDSKYRNGAKALDLAQTAVEFDKSYHNIGTLAAAYAEVGSFKEAIKTQENAIALLNKHTDPKVLAEAKEHLECYKSHRPWREPKASEGNP